MTRRRRLLTAAAAIWLAGIALAFVADWRAAFMYASATVVVAAIFKQGYDVGRRSR